MSDWKWISVADSAKFIRKALKENFPGVKFYVKSSSYSMGASVDINWVDGPTEKEVKAVISVFKGKSFDGMIDMGVSNYAYILPNGTIEFARTLGTEGSGGCIAAHEAPKPSGAKLVRFGSDYVGTTRHYTPEFVQAVVDTVAEHTGWDKPEIKRQSIYLTKKNRPEGAYIEPDFNGTENETYRRVQEKTSAYPKLDIKSALNDYFGVPVVIEPEPEPEPEIGEAWRDGQFAAIVEPEPEPELESVSEWEALLPWMTPKDHEEINIYRKVDGGIEVAWGFWEGRKIIKDVRSSPVTLSKTDVQQLVGIALYL